MSRPKSGRRGRPPLAVELPYGTLRGTELARLVPVAFRESSPLASEARRTIEDSVGTALEAAAKAAGDSHGVRVGARRALELSERQWHRLRSAPWLRSLWDRYQATTGAAVHETA